MTKAEIKEKVKELIAAPSCYAGLKAVAEEWLQKEGTAEEKTLSAKLIDELEADVEPIENVISLFRSEAGIKMVGAETAAQMVAHFEEVKAAGGKWCDCPACQIGLAILENKSVLL